MNNPVLKFLGDIAILIIASLVGAGFFDACLRAELHWIIGGLGGSTAALVVGVLLVSLNHSHNEAEDEDDA